MILYIIWSKIDFELDSLVLLYIDSDNKLLIITDTLVVVVSIFWLKFNTEISNHYAILRPYNIFIFLYLLF